MALWNLPINPKTKPKPNRQGHYLEVLSICNTRGKKKSQHRLQVHTLIVKVKQSRTKKTPPRKKMPAQLIIQWILTDSYLESHFDLHQLSGQATLTYLHHQQHMLTYI